MRNAHDSPQNFGWDSCAQTVPQVLRLQLAIQQRIIQPSNWSASQAAKQQGNDGVLCFPTIMPSSQPNRQVSNQPSNQPVTTQLVQRSQLPDN